MVRRGSSAVYRRHGFRSSIAVTTGALLCVLLFESACQLPLVEEEPEEQLFEGEGEGEVILVPPPALNRGRYWLGINPSCISLGVKWLASPKIFFTTSGPPLRMCLYTWNLRSDPSATDISNLFASSGATNLAEDLPVVVADLNQDLPVRTLTTWSASELDLYEGLRSSLLQRVGTAEMLPSFPPRPVARIVVIDTAPDAKHGQITIGAGSRHGDNLAHLIEDIVCKPVDFGPRQCAAEVTSQLALRWSADGNISSSEGGFIGKLGELAEAIQQATLTWKQGRIRYPEITPERLILNLSVSWEHLKGVADCSVGSANDGPAGVLAVRAALDVAAFEGALIIAAAGNDSGGPSPAQGPTCPGKYQTLPRASGSPYSLLLAVSGVDYDDDPLAITRPQGTTPIVGLGFGGVAWKPGELAPPMLIGSSISTAVVSAVAGVVWAYQSSLSAGQVSDHLYNGGVVLSATAEACPPQFSPDCHTSRVRVCGALNDVADAEVVPCPSPPSNEGSSPSLPAEIAALDEDYPSLQLIPTELVGTNLVARNLYTTAQVAPWTFPAPGSATCPTCVVRDHFAAFAPTAGTSGSTLLLIPQLRRKLERATLVVSFGPQEDFAVWLGDTLHENMSYRFEVPTGLPMDRPIVSARLSGRHGKYSVTDQLFVHRAP